jgi:hypothetical protein
MVLIKNLLSELLLVTAAMFALVPLGRQALKAGETEYMPVIFYLDPTLPKAVQVITLSYI